MCCLAKGSQNDNLYLGRFGCKLAGQAQVQPSRATTGYAHLLCGYLPENRTPRRAPTTYRARALYHDYGSNKPTDRTLFERDLVQYCCARRGAILYRLVAHLPLALRDYLPIGDRLSVVE